MPPKRKERTDGSAEGREIKKYARLTPHVRHIAENTIKSKWTTLPDSVQDKVKDIFQSIERPVITRHRDERKRIEAQSALSAVRKKYAVCSIYSCLLMHRLNAVCFFAGYLASCIIDWD